MTEVPNFNIEIIKHIVLSMGRASRGSKCVMWYVYIIQCKDNKLYTGITNNLDRRLAEHNSGHGGRFTRFRKPVKLVYWQETIDKSGALEKEADIKKLRHKEKITLISFFNEWHRIRKGDSLHWKPDDNRLKEFIKISPKIKLEWLRHMQEFATKCSLVLVNKIRNHLEAMR